MDTLPLLTPFDAATMIEALDERGCGLRVAFFRPAGARDRWGHVVATVENAGRADERVAARLWSCEGAGPDGWPLSPPLQSLSIEVRAEGAVALLVGMSGQSHWSASFEVVNSQRRLVMDMACRLGSGAGPWRLGSSYATDLALAANAAGFALDLGGNRRLLVEFGPEIEGKVTSGGVNLEVRQTAATPIRWKYQLHCG